MPTTINAYQNLAILKQKKGEIDRSIDICRQALAYAGDNLGVYDNYLYFLSYHPATTQKNILEKCRAWEKKLKSTLPDWSPEYRGRPDPNRRLRIGYVSPDFIGHVVTYFFNGILENHDRDNFEIHLFANVGKPDASTDYLKSLSDCWHDIFGKNTIRAAETIRDAEIDILIDLAGHTAGNSLPVFALRRRQLSELDRLRQFNGPFGDRLPIYRRHRRPARTGRRILFGETGSFEKWLSLL